MFKEENYEEYLDVLRNQYKNYCESVNIPSVHPIDIFMGKLIFILLCQRIQDNIDDVIEKHISWIKHIYEKDKDIIDKYRNEFLNRVDKINNSFSEIQEEDKFNNSLNQFNDYMKNISKN